MITMAQALKDLETQGVISRETYLEYAQSQPDARKAAEPSRQGGPRW